MYFYYENKDNDGQNTKVDCVGHWNNWSECPSNFQTLCGTTERRHRKFEVTTQAANGGKACDYANGALELQVCLTRELPTECIPKTTSYGFPKDYPNNMHCEEPITTEEDCRAAAEALDGTLINDRGSFAGTGPMVKGMHTRLKNSMCVKVNGTSPVYGEILFNDGGQEQKMNSLINFPPICKFFNSFEN